MAWDDLSPHVALDPGPTYEQWLQNSSWLMISSGGSLLTYIKTFHFFGIITIHELGIPFLTN